tara:strand:+ start:19 stop:189 length:171 start_codon:yes stop_codon:yes gene_type:complete
MLFYFFCISNPINAYLNSKSVIVNDKVNSNILIIMLKFLEIVDTAKNRTFIKKTVK